MRYGEEAQTYIPGDIPEEPTLSLKVCVDIKAYAKHDPPLICEVTTDWYNMCVRITGENKQVDMDIKATADTGAQVDVIGTDHIGRMGLEIEYLLRSKMSLNCANNSLAGNLAVLVGHKALIKNKNSELRDGEGW